MSACQSLMDLCIRSIASNMPQINLISESAATLEPVLLQRIHDEYLRLDSSRRLSARHSAPAHHEAMRQFAAFWQPAVLSLQMPETPASALTELAAFSSSLLHLQLLCDVSNSNQLACLTSLTVLACLSLRGVVGLQDMALQQVLRGLPQLRALDLCGVPAVNDNLAPALASLQQLEVLNLNRTQCSDTLVDWLTYGHRLHDWQQAAKVQQQRWQQRALGVPAAAGQSDSPDHQLQQSQMQQWPRCKIHQWHLAYTRVTAHTAQLLSCISDLIFLDMRGSGVTASQLVPLRRKFSLNASQGAVLSRSAAMTLAAVALGGFVCCQPVEHNSMAATSRSCNASSAAHSSGSGLQSWVQLGVRHLITARTELEKQERQAPAVEANSDAALAAQQTSAANMQQPMDNTISGPNQAAWAGDGLPRWYPGPPRAAREVALSYPLSHDQDLRPAGWPPAV